MKKKKNAKKDLSQKIKKPPKFNDVFKKQFGIENGIDLSFLEKHSSHQTIDFNL